jgi:hypothetical protein
LNAFASHFESEYTVSNDSDERVEPNGSRVRSDTIDLNYFDISVEQIISKMKNLELGWTPGSDGIPSGFINLCADSLVFPLNIIFNKSLSTGAFPLHWKTEDIIPIHKSGSKTVVENYRGISIMSVFPKILDSIVSDVITNTVKNIIIDEQHGFLKGKSTTTNLFVLTEYVINCFEKNMEVDCIYTDLKKAFDRGDISKLCLKLSIVGIGDPLLSWINSYLTNRKQKVRITSHRSREIKVTSGVPQGSHLGPVLFSIFINNIKNVIRDSLFLLYADDLKLFYNIKSEQDCVRIQDDLCQVVSWCESNGLELNISKCKVIRYSRKKIITLPSYHIHNSALECLFQISDLGIILDNKLTFCSYIEKIVKNSNKMLGFMVRQCSEFDNLRALVLLYNALVRSNLEHNTIWFPLYQNAIHRIEKNSEKVYTICLL